VKKSGRIAAGGLILAALIAAYVGHVRKDMSDFGVCYRGAGRILVGETLYRASDGHLQYKYAPVSAFFYVPFGLLPWEAAKAAWFALQIALLIVCFGISYQLLPGDKKGPVFAAGIGFLILAKYLGREIELGQVNLLILALLLAMLRSLRRRRDGWAGVFWAGSLFFKPYALVFLPYLALKGKWKTLLAGSATLLLGLMAPFVSFGRPGNLAVHKEWIASLTNSTPGLLAVGDNASLYAFFLKNGGGESGGLAGGLFLAGAALLSGLFLYLFVRGRRGLGSPEVLETAFLLILVPMFSPLGWNYAYLYGLPAVVLVLGFFEHFPLIWRIALVANFALIGGTLREVLGKTLFQFYTFHALAAINFLFVLAALAFLRVRKIA